MLYTYIKKSQPGKYVAFDKPLSAEEYNNIGSSWDDYINGKWVMLSDQQIIFRDVNPNATLKEVWDMSLTAVPEKTLDDAKLKKIQDVEEYDGSSAVNSFMLGDQSMWLTVEERQQIATQINANESIGRENMTRWFNGHSYTFPLSTWKQMLIALEVYAGDSLNVTESHKAAINAMNSITDVEAYDYTQGYPEKLVF